MFLWWCGGVFSAFFLFLCWCGGVFVVVFLTMASPSQYNE